MLLKQKPLQSIAILIWMLIGLSVVARELTVFDIVVNFAKSFAHFNNFFDTAQSSLHHDWEGWRRDMRESRERFQKESDAFHAYTQKHMLKTFANLGYDVSDGTVQLKKDEPKPPEKKSSDIEK